MDLFPIRRRMEEDVISDVTVTDVYDQAAGIGKEFEKLIESYGVDAVTDLMPKVIRALEQLEALASKYEKESSEINELRYAVEKLETEKADRNQERVRFEEELIQIEETWQKESREQIASIGRLQEENRRLRSSLSEQKQAVVEEVAAVTKRTEEKEIEVLTKLKETVDRQREEIRKYSREMKQKNVDVEALQAQSERLVKINIELRRKNQSHKKHARTLITEKVDLETQLAEKEHQVLKVKEMIKEQESLDDHHVPERRHNRETEDVGLEGAEAPEVTLVTDGGIQTNDNSDHLPDKLSLIGKIVIDKQDPNRPRFTLNELRTVLMERNELKAKLMEVEEELGIFKPKEDGIDGNSNALCDELSSADNDSMLSNDGEEDEDLPVQGPINKEPFDKIHGKRPSGIRRFFEEFKDRFNLPIDILDF
ncbi:RILP-like protein 1 isoform X3 [Mercenaria mercenaria]|uniref:RILP-like protein 1 isoform X3 n=1 Tax=Mercenaria mercenaria TaxID=6596 RepID=UPI001E1E2121|nr:RILP-like protein 1 isoform X3 [Mercenaria mercenaria]